MNDRTIEGIQGQVRALATTLTAVITCLPPDAAARAARNMRASLDVDREQELQAGENSPTTIASRDAIADAFLELLEARSRT